MTAVRDPSAESPTPHRATVLVVDDDLLVRGVVSEMLASLGHEVMVAEAPDEALAAMRDSRPVDLLLTDVVLPGENGPEFAARCRALRPGLRVLFMSGYVDRAIVERQVLERGESFIQKPFSREELAFKLREALERR
ncbi:MAG: response regulator [Thermoleophilia bacterium]|nr:response regulator [Thermoleophilia bacterium]